MLPLAAISDDSLSNYVTGLVMLAVTGGLSFFVRQAFADVKTSLNGLSTKLDTLNNQIQSAIKDNAVMDQRVKALEADVRRLERMIQDLSEGIIK